jgi:hypothetical protein
VTLPSLKSNCDHLPRFPVTKCKDFPEAGQRVEGVVYSDGKSDPPCRFGGALAGRHEGVRHEGARRECRARTALVDLNFSFDTSPPSQLVCLQV